MFPGIMYHIVRDQLPAVLNAISDASDQQQKSVTNTKNTALNPTDAQEASQTRSVRACSMSFLFYLIKLTQKTAARRSLSYCGFC